MLLRARLFERGKALAITVVPWHFMGQLAKSLHALVESCPTTFLTFYPFQAAAVPAWSASSRFCYTLFIGLSTLLVQACVLGLALARRRLRRRLRWRWPAGRGGVVRQSQAAARGKQTPIS